MKTLLRNAMILTMKENEDIFHGEIVIEDGKITFIGDIARDDNYDSIIECDNNLIMPGFKNAHAHSAMSFARSCSDDLSLSSWLNDCIFPMEANIAPEDQYYLSKVSILEYLTSGITACFDMYYNPMEMLRASEDIGFRCVLLGTVTKYRESVQEMVEAYKTINNPVLHPLVTYRLGYHAEYTCTDEILSELAKAANELKTPIFTHLSETENEVRECIDRHSCTPIEYMERLGLLNYGGGGFHCVHVSDHDIEIFKKRGLHMVTCPGSNSKLASGIALVDRFIHEGINVAIGTDGAGSNNGLDFFYEMRLAAVLQKLINKDPSAGQALDYLKAATVGGARAMGLDNCDVLDIGKCADIIMIDLSRPNMQPINNISKNIVYSGSKDNIKMTMINGRVLYKDGKFFINEPIDAIYEKAQEITDRLKSH